MTLLRLIFSLLFALLLTIIPFPEVLQWCMPDWCLLALFAWYMAKPGFLSIWVAWVLGIALDGLTGSLLSLHALAFCLTFYVLSLFSQRIRLFPMPQQMVVVGGLALFNIVILLCTQALFSASDVSWHRLYSVFSTALCWPVALFLVTKMLYRRPRKQWGAW